MVAAYHIRKHHDAHHLSYEPLLCVSVLLRIHCIIGV